MFHYRRHALVSLLSTVFATFILLSADQVTCSMELTPAVPVRVAANSPRFVGSDDDAVALERAAALNISSKRFWCLFEGGRTRTLTQTRKYCFFPPAIPGEACCSSWYPRPLWLGFGSFGPRHLESWSCSGVLRHCASRANVLLQVF